LIDDKAAVPPCRRAGLAQAHGLKNYRLQQLYRAATKELAAEVGEVSVCRRNSGCALAPGRFRSMRSSRS